MRALRTLHVYVALVVALPLLLMVLSGAGLVFKESVWRLQHPELAAPVPELDASDHGAALDAIGEAFDADPTLVKWPQEGVAAYQVWLSDGSEAFVEPVSRRVIAHWHWYQTPMSVLEEIHLHLLAGDAGATLAGILGLVLLGLVLSGQALWWPRRRLFRWRSLVPTGFARPGLLNFHYNLGTLLSPVTIVLLGAGVGVAFFQPARVVLNGLFGDEAGPALATLPSIEAPSLERAPMAALVESAQEVLPEGELVFFYPERNESGVVMVRKRMPAEIHPNGLSFLFLDASDGSAIKVIDASKAPPGDKVANGLYPVHSAKWGGTGYKLVVLLHGLLLACILLSGVTAYCKGYRRARPVTATRVEPVP